MIGFGGGMGFGNGGNTTPPPPVTPNLQQVTDEGNATTNNLVVSDGANTMRLEDSALVRDIGTAATTLNFTNPTVNRTQTFQDKSGTIALTDDIYVQGFVVAAGTNSYIATLTPAITSYTTGLTVQVQFTNANTAASTLNLNGLGAKSIVKNTNQALASGDILAGQILTLTYDGTNFQIVGKYNNFYAVAAGTNTYVATLNPAINAYITGLTVQIQFTNANTAASTLNLNGLGVKNIVKDSTLALVTGDIVANQVLTLVYDGTNFQIVSKTIAANSITNALLAPMAANTVKANATGASANPQDIALTANTVLGRTDSVNSGNIAPQPIQNIIFGTTALIAGTRSVVDARITTASKVQAWAWTGVGVYTSVPLIGTAAVGSMTFTTGQITDTGEFNYTIVI